MVLSVSPPVQSQIVSSLLDQITAELSQDQNLVRIKKLLLYVCTGTWENDPQRLSRAPLDVLLQYLFDSSPTLEQLQQQLNQVVASLNKSAEYTIVANVIISRFHAVYARLQQAQPDANQAFYKTVAEHLQQEPNLTRIKKLLLLACRSTWENNAEKLAQLSLLDLVRELHQIAPTAESLEASLTQVAQALSKPDAYIKIAATISHAFQSVNQEQENQCEPLSDMTEWLPIPEIVGQDRSSQMSDATPDYPTCTLTHLPKLSDLSTGAKPHKAEFTQTKSQSIFPVASQNITKSISRSISKPISPQPTSDSPVQTVLVLAQPQKLTDLFNLRLEIMQDANPLRAKILLFSLLHERFQGTAEHDAFLRTHELDDLLRVFFLSYRLYSEAETQLRLGATSLTSSDYLQVAEAILRAIQPFYTEVEAVADSVPIPPPISALNPPSEITSMKADTNEITLPERQ